MKKLLAAIGFICVASSAGAVELNGVQVADAVKLGTTDLVLNGTGLRTRAIFKVYVGALYLPEKKSNAADVLAMKGAKRVALHLLRDLSADQVAGALDNMGDNLSDAEREKLKPQIADLKATMEAVGEAKEKSIITIDFVPGSGTRVALNGAQKGKTIAGDDFYAALLRIWLGDKPVDRDLKSGMLGAAK
jgi:parvulin-like peptidyl-prolyl isomerase